MVNRETTNGVRVTAVSYYMGCKENQQGKKFWVSTPIMVYVGQATCMWDDIKILGHLVCPFVCMSVCVYVVGRYQKFDGVPHKKYWVYFGK